MTENNNLNPNPNKPAFDKWQAASLAIDMGFIIALPLVAFALLGKFLDIKLGSEPWITVAGILLAIISTTIWLTKKFRNYIK